MKDILIDSQLLASVVTDTLVVLVVVVVVLAVVAVVLAVVVLVVVVVVLAVVVVLDTLVAGSTVVTSRFVRLLPTTK